MLKPLTICILYLSITCLKAHSQVWDNFWQLKTLLKMMKNAFYFTSKVLFILKIFRFLSWLFGHVAKRLDRKIRLISNFMMSQPVQQTIVIYILSNISRSKDNQIMKLGQLIKCNMRNIFLEKSYTKCGRETSPRPFSEKLKLTISLDQWPKFCTVCFYCMASSGLSKYIEAKLQATCFHLILSFLQNRKRSGTSLLVSFSA